mgnify:CR=1 FL=1
MGESFLSSEQTVEPPSHLFAFEGPYKVKYHLVTTAYRLTWQHTSHQHTTLSLLRRLSRLLFRERILHLAVKRHTNRKTSIAACVAAVACSSLVVAGCIGYGIAAAGGGSAEGDSFGLSSASLVEEASSASEVSEAVSSDGIREKTVLTSAARRDISQGVQEIADEEEAARIAAEEAKRAEEQAHIEAAEAARAKQQAKSGQEAMASLSDVNWEAGEDAFIEEWTERIDSYLAGSPLAGQGAVFAEAAWKYGVDPRWSPAISNTESSKGANCFASYNAWGWGKSGWSSWEEAIDAHVGGLSRSYGYTISYANAKKYCPPNYDNWFRDTLNEMKKI